MPLLKSCLLWVFGSFPSYIVPVCFHNIWLRFLNSPLQLYTGMYEHVIPYYLKILFRNVKLRIKNANVSNFGHKKKR